MKKILLALLTLTQVSFGAAFTISDNEAGILNRFGERAMPSGFNLGTKLQSLAAGQYAGISGTTLDLSGAFTGTTIAGTTASLSGTAGPLLTVTDGGTFGTNADPYISFADGAAGTKGKVGYLTSNSNTFSIQNAIATGLVCLNANATAGICLNPASSGTFSYGFAGLNTAHNFTGSVTISNVLTTTPQTAVNLTADNQVVTVSSSVILLSSDDGTSTNRSIVLSQGAAGQRLTLIWNDTDAGELVDDAAMSAGNVRLAGTWTPGIHDTLQLVGDGTDWVEVTRANN